MTTFVSLLRGINVGGKNKLPMKELIALLNDIGLSHVETYIQSGNIVFQSDISDVEALSARISAAISNHAGFSPHVLTLTRVDFQKAMTNNPFPDAVGAPKTLHLFFLAGVPTAPDLACLDTYKKESERFQLIDAVFYLHAPDGIGRSKLAANVEKAMGVPITARNWRSVEKIMAIAQSL
ncbi:MAG: DUF1697 domain-containing protein [Cyanobacteria bacterium J06649_4]